jgi:hypothetical protein
VAAWSATVDSCVLKLGRPGTVVRPAVPVSVFVGEGRADCRLDELVILEYDGLPVFPP